MHHSLATEFKPGEHPSPATEIKKNQRLSPETEFKKGHIPANKKLTTQQEQEILTKWQNGQSKRSLAREYKIDRSSIQRITDKG
jgi:DNA-binding NarL/FixJ family response regulator